MMRIEVSINDEVIHDITVVNIGPPMPTVHIDDRLYHWSDTRKLREGVVEHRRSDGALVLVATVTEALRDQS